MKKLIGEIKRGQAREEKVADQPVGTARKWRLEEDKNLQSHKTLHSP